MPNASKGMAASLNRRELIKRGAIVGGTLAWTVPVVQTLSLTPAHAESPSAPGNPVPNNPLPNNPAPAAQPKPAPAAGGPGLAQTGATIPLLGAVAVGAAAVAVGAAVVATTRSTAPEASGPAPDGSAER